MTIRITEQIAVVIEVSYDLDLPTLTEDAVYRESNGESVEDYRDDWQEVHRETINKHTEIMEVGRRSRERAGVASPDA